MRINNKSVAIFIYTKENFPMKNFNMIAIDDEMLILDEITNINWVKRDINLIATATNGIKGLELFDSLRPEVVLLDIEMPIINGLELAKKMLDIIPTTQIIFLTSHKDFEYAQKSIQLGALGYVIKSLDMEQDLYESIDKAKSNILAFHELQLRRTRLKYEKIRSTSIDFLQGTLLDSKYLS